MTAAAASMSFGDKAKLWGVAVRAYSFPASIVPVLLGSAYAAYESAHAARLGQPAARADLAVRGAEPGQAQVRHLDGAGGVEHEVVRLDVAMDDAAGVGIA